MMVTYLYTLADPRIPGIVRYVGITKYKAQRYYHHVKSGSRKISYKECWVASLLRAGVKPQMAIIGTFNDEEEAYEAEQETIKEYRLRFGKKLTNGNDGGRHNLHHNERTRGILKIRWAERVGKGTQMRANHFCTEETRKKISEGNKGKIPPNKGKAMSAEQRIKLSIAHKGKPAWNKGVQHTQKHKDNLKKAWDYEKHFTEETRKKLSEKTTLYWLNKKYA